MQYKVKVTVLDKKALSGITTGILRRTGQR